MKVYIDQAAYEMNTKTLQWRNGLTNGVSNVSAISAIKHAINLRGDEGANALATENMLDITASSLPESSMQYLRIPHQKLSLGIGIAEEVRAMAGDVAQLAQDPALITRVYGIKRTAAISTADMGPYSEVDSASETGSAVGGAPDTAERVTIASRPMSMALPRPPIVRQLSKLKQAKSFDSVSSRARAQSATISSAAGVAQTTEAGHDTIDPIKSSFVSDALSELSGTDVVLKQMGALSIPPLPPNLGSLRQPDGREYRLKFLII
jgi:hypothetical protein